MTSFVLQATLPVASAVVKNLSKENSHKFSVNQQHHKKNNQRLGDNNFFKDKKINCHIRNQISLKFVTLKSSQVLEDDIDDRQRAGNDEAADNWKTEDIALKENFVSFETFKIRVD